MTTKTMIAAPRHFAGDADVEPICDLLNACDAVDKVDDNYAVEDLRLEFQSPELDTARDLRLWEDENGRLMGFGQTWVPTSREYSDVFTYVRVHPDARGQGLESEIMAWCEERAREVAAKRELPGRLFGRTRDYDAYGRGILEEQGYQLVRYFFLMKRPLNEPIPEPQFPEGFTMRHAEGEGDIERWVEMFNQSFIDHWNHHPMDLEGHEHWLSSPKYNPERNLIALAPDGTFAAFCFCWIDPDDNARNNRNEGWIDILGTRRGYRKIGLGRAMLLAGLHRLKADGVETAKLGVDAENPTGALRLYESVGFYKEHTNVSYCKEL
jgi:mycothiol synthase